MALTIGFTSVPPTVDGMLMWACCRIPHFLAIEKQFSQREELGFYFTSFRQTFPVSLPTGARAPTASASASAAFTMRILVWGIKKRWDSQFEAPNGIVPNTSDFRLAIRKNSKEEAIGNLLTFCGRMDPNLRQKITSTKHLVSFSFPQDWSNVGTPEKIFQVCLFVFVSVCVCACGGLFFGTPWYTLRSRKPIVPSEKVAFHASKKATRCTAL